MPNPQYQSYPFILSSKGLNSRNTIDRIPDHQYYNLDNAEVRQEGSLASRLGRLPITYGPRGLIGPNVILPLPDTDIHNLARLKGLGSEAYRYAGAGQNLYRERTPGFPSGHFNLINGAFVFSGNQWSSANYRPDNSSTPYIFFADDDVMVKDNGSFNPVEQWGIFPPTAPPILSLGNPLVQVIDSFPVAPGSYGVNGFTTPTSAGLVSTTLGTAITAAPGFFTVTPASMTNIIANSIVNVGTENNVLVFAVSNNTFTAYFNNNHASSDAVVSNGISVTSTSITGNVEGNVTFSSVAATQLNAGAGNIYLGVKFSDYTKVNNLEVTFYTTNNGAYDALLSPTTSPPIGQTNNYQEIAIPVSSFVLRGGAGTPGNTWANVSSWAINLFWGVSSGETLTLGNLSYIGGAGPTVTGTGASPYDYRITFYNINTGDESGPSVVMATPSFINPMGQPVIVNFAAAVTPPPPLDPQITHIRIYRRGGTLPNQWLQVGQVPIGTTTFTDTLVDQQIATNNILNVDTAPPVTSTLPVPVNTTLTSAVTVPGENIVSVGSTANMFVYQALTIDPLTSVEETVLVQAVAGGNITAYFQFPHSIGAIVQANTRAGQPCNIAAIAFNRAWIAGDPNNPDILYYSDVFNPESFPVENFLEIGSPSDPIMAVMEWNGQLYVFTQNTVWNILGAQEGSQAPLPFKTAAKHGLQAQFGWCIAEGEIYYQSFGGIYAFQGSDSRYASADIEWIFTAQFIDDDIQRVVPLMDPTKISQTVMAYYQNEIYVAYTGQDGNTHRVIWDKVHGRWRNDDVPAICMLVEDDIYTLLFGTTTGMIYQDRIGNYDAGGLTGPDPIAFNVQTAALDLGMPKNFKNFNEFTIDIDTGGLPVTITLLFDYGLTPVPLGTVTTTGGRGQFEFNINNGDGQLSLNVSVQLTTSITTNITSPIEVYELHIRATPEAELRESYDSYIMDFGSPDYKFVKQSWVEYMALDPGGITFNWFVGASTTPTFTFTVPQSLTRTSKRVRHPATKGRIWRCVATSASPFRLYSDSRIEWKAVTQDKGYQVRPLQQETPQQP